MAWHSDLAVKKMFSNQSFLCPGPFSYPAVGCVPSAEMVESSHTFE
jgi:hypothetical protein